MNNDWVRLTILLSILLLIVFPFAGLAPLTLLFFAAVCGWAFRIAGTIIGATEPTESD
ncbi:MAG: hypothetical protein WA783_15685 [Phormidesmis sp.]